MKFLGAHIGYWIAGALALWLFTLVLAYGIGSHTGNKTGGLECQNTQLSEQKKTDDKVKKGYDEIDHDTPYTGSRDVRIDWLLDNARSGK